MRGDLSCSNRMTSPTTVVDVDYGGATTNPQLFPQV